MQDLKQCAIPLVHEGTNEPQKAHGLYWAPRMHSPPEAQPSGCTPLPIGYWRLAIPLSVNHSSVGVSFL